MSPGLSSLAPANSAVSPYTHSINTRRIPDLSSAIAADDIVNIVSPVAIKNLFEQLASIPSPSGHEQKISRFIQGYLKNIGISAITDTQPKGRFDHKLTGLNAAPYLPEAYYIVEPKSGSILVYDPGYPLQSTNDFLFPLWDTHMDTVNSGSEVNAKHINVIAEEKPNPTTGAPDTIFRTDGKTVLGGDAKTTDTSLLYILSVLQHLKLSQIPHGPSVTLISTGEETMTGAPKIPVRYLCYGNQPPWFIASLDQTGLDLGKLCCASTEMTQFNVSVQNRMRRTDKSLLPTMLRFVKDFPTGLVSSNPFMSANIGAINTNIPDAPDRKGMFNSYPETVDIWISADHAREVNELEAELLEQINSYNSNLKARAQELHIDAKTIALIDTETVSIKPVQSRDDRHIWQIHVDGKPAHPATAAQPGPKGVNPIAPIASFLSGLPANIHVLDIRTNDSRIPKRLPEAPNRIDITGEFRSEKAGETLKQLETLHQELKQLKPRDLDYTFAINPMTRPYTFSDKNPSIRFLLRALKRITDSAPDLRKPKDRDKPIPTAMVKGGSDANVLHHTILESLGIDVPTCEIPSGYEYPHSRKEIASLNMMIALAKLQLLVALLSPMKEREKPRKQKPFVHHWELVS